MVLALLMSIKSAAGMLPGINSTSLLAGLGNQYLGPAVSPAIGWILHFLIGTVLWGLAYAALRPVLPKGDDIGKGIVFSIGA